MPKNNKNNKTYTKEQKEAMVAKLLPPNNVPVATLSAETGIAKSTLNEWKTKALGVQSKSQNSIINKKAITPNDKFHIVLDTYTLSEYELSEYCRKHGLYVDEVKKWRITFASAMDKEPEAVKVIKEELLEEKKKNKQLEKELNRKEKALAEAAALLVLQKKFQAFLGGEEV
jgi:transposase-like protein